MSDRPGTPSDREAIDARRRKMASVVAGTVGLGAAAGLTWWQTAATDRIADSFWQEVLWQPDGTQLHLQGWRGKPLLVNFWATWCPPCVKELPEIEDFYKQLKPGSVNFLAFAVDKPEPVQRFLQAHPLTLPVVIDAGRGLAWVQALGSSDGALPLSVILDAQGRVQFRKIGRLMPSDFKVWSALLG